jgi:hypothetical protein
VLLASFTHGFGWTLLIFFAELVSRVALEIREAPRERRQLDRQAYETANRTLLDHADRLVAVWNGAPPSGKGGGTADVVVEAREAGLPVDVVWPEGAQRRA